jgi:hypothetical protein
MQRQRASPTPSLYEVNAAVAPTRGSSPAQACLDCRPVMLTPAEYAELTVANATRIAEARDERAGTMEILERFGRRRGPETVANY